MDVLQLTATPLLAPSSGAMNMVSYRLLVDRGDLVGQFEAIDHDAARRLAQQLSMHAQPTCTTGFALEVQEDGRWRAVQHWMPASVRYRIDDTRHGRTPW